MFSLEVFSGGLDYIVVTRWLQSARAVLDAIQNQAVQKPAGVKKRIWGFARRSCHLGMGAGTRGSEEGRGTDARARAHRRTDGLSCLYRHVAMLAAWRTVRRRRSPEKVCFY